MNLALAVPALAPTGILTWINTKTAEATTTLIVVASLVVVVLLIASAIRSRGAIASIVVAAFAGALFLWLVSNIDVVSRMVGSEVASGLPVVQEHESPLQPPPATKLHPTGTPDTIGPHRPVHDVSARV